MLLEIKVIKAAYKNTRKCIYSLLKSTNIVINCGMSVFYRITLNILELLYVPNKSNITVAK